MKILFEHKGACDQIADKTGCQNRPIRYKENSFVVLGENLKVLASLLDNYRGKIDLVYIDPPFNTAQVFSVSKNRANAVSRQQGGCVAYSDAMTKEDFLEFMYERFVLIKELLSDAGSLYVHIDTKMGHYFKIILDEVFGENSFINDITRIKSNPKNFARKAYGNQKDMILFYSKTQKHIWNEIRTMCTKQELEKRYRKIDADGRRYTTIPLHAPGETNSLSPTGSPWRGMNPPEGRHWRTDPAEFEKLDAQGLIEWSSTGNPRIKKYADEHRGKKIQDVWEYKDPQHPMYPTEKNLEMLERIIKQSSNESSVVLDCFAGSGTTLLAAAKNNRRFIGVDQSSVAVDVIKKRLCEYDVEYIEFTEEIGEHQNDVLINKN